MSWCWDNPVIVKSGLCGNACPAPADADHLPAGERKKQLYSGSGSRSFRVGCLVHVSSSQGVCRPSEFEVNTDFFGTVLHVHSDMSLSKSTPFFFPLAEAVEGSEPSIHRGCIQL